mmetsp:Transcript_3317/g.4796  ORF Transcript_3317/g.4796 Transcript_3317/m.4796 type:complete len:245 (-) Transcript_3317:4005-4739(-)|eukprot:CAMPEP_0203775742 /NCGR_PEP_ID=MMETSP0099_2-20121227/6307_1 /ASSEMBLY_ACC=CAM_ASM_000209 /TAXON_ID=96639 /ORGANISM=" , Strain NY0313808BC1" /LENGTH=244 /DNA_ID=CAMNT_0050674567 /DNA_START=166 /DNA_END=900 /DNA_ORIENTATION=+
MQRVHKWFNVFGANTDVGKTVAVTGLALAALRRCDHVGYIKPVQTGSAHGHSDEATIAEYVNEFANASLDYGRLHMNTLYSWGEPVSPHIAAKGDENLPSDQVLYDRVLEEMERMSKCEVGIIETAGGVLSPAPSGTPQASLYYALPMNHILVADGKLGGISTTLTSLEALDARDCSVSAVLMIEDKSLGNGDYIRDYWQEAKCFSLPMLPEDPETPLFDWHAENSPIFDNILEHILEQDNEDI